MLALFPGPHVLGIVTAAAAQIDGQFALCAQPSSVLPAASLSLQPCHVMSTSAHALVRAAAHAERRVECPAELRAAKRRRLLEWNRRR